MPFSAWLVDPLARDWDLIAVAVCALAWLVITVLARRRVREQATRVVAALVLLALLVLTGKFVTLAALGENVDATPVHVGDNQGTLIDVEARWETPRGEVMTLRDASPVVHITYPADSVEQVVSFMVLPRLPVVHQYGHRAMLSNWRLLASVLVLLSFAAYARWAPRRDGTP